MTEGLAGTGTLLRLTLRRDRVMLPLWVAVFVVMASVSADATVGLYPDPASRVQAAEAINGTPSLVALYGRIYDVTSLGAIAMIKMGGIGSALLAVLAFMLVIRHTRAEEEVGRLELLAGGVLGVYAPLAAALACAIGTALAAGLLTAVALAAAGLDLAGSLAFGLAWAATGIAFAGVGAVAAQLTTGARAARGLAAAALGAAYLARAVGDSTGGENPSWLSWFSPIGWGQQVRPYAGDRWPVFLILLAFAAACTTLAFVLNRRRDLDAGMFPDRLGPATASVRLRSPLALAWRLQRGVLLAWASGFALLGLVLGNVASNIGDMLESPQSREMITKLGGVAGLTDAFIAAEIGFMGVVAAAFGVQAALRLHGEETSLRLEAVLGTAVGRVRWIVSHTSVALLGPVALVAVFGLAVGAANAAQTGAAGDLAGALTGALVQLPAIWVLVGIVVAVYGLVPRLAAAGWAALVVFLLLGELGPLLELPSWAMDLSPFTHVPRLPGGDLRLAPLLWLTLVAAVLLTVGIAAFRRRDIAER
jgi:ABC-2 type transport system permease protein